MSKSIFSTAVFAVAALTAFSTAFAQQTTPGQPTRPNSPIAGTQINQTGSQHASGPTVTEAIVKKLQKANDAEIELAKMAEQQSENDDLKKLASMIVKDHQAFNQELKKFSDMNLSSAPNAQGQNNQLGSRPAVASQTQTNLVDSQSPRVPEQLCQVSEQACDNALEMTKEMLGKYKGQDFAMAFLGQQCVAHTMFLAELKAIESVGPQELRPIAQKAGAKVKEHLEKAKQLAEKLEDDKDSDSDR